MRALTFAVLASLAVSTAVAAQSDAKDTLAELAKLDAQQKDMVARGDTQGLRRLAAPGLTINAPTNRILTHDQFFAMMKSGQIRAEAFERQVESVSVSGDTGIVMGSEVFTPTADSELGKAYGAVPLKRRYTNVYIHEHGRWQWLARHANVVTGPPAGSGIR